MKKNLRIGEILTELGYVTEEQMGQALAYQREHRDMRVGQILVELGFVSELQVLEAMASRLELEIVDVSALEVDLAAVAMISKDLAEKNLLLPVQVRPFPIILRKPAPERRQNRQMPALARRNWKILI